MRIRIGMRTSAFIVVVVLGVESPTVVHGDDPPVGLTPAEQQAAADRLTTMTLLARDCQLSRDSDTRKPYVLEPKPLLRWSNPISGVVDGSLWLWTHEGRPVVTVDIFSGNKLTWNQQWQSLSAEPFECRQYGHVRWPPQKPGLELKPVPEAAVPAKTSAGRLTQMRAIAREFAIEDDFKTVFRGKEFATHELRLLAQPLYRYGDSEQLVKDGALFAYVLATACEALLILEVGEVDSQPVWLYSLA